MPEIKRITNTPLPDPKRWAQAHIQGDSRAPIGMIDIPKPSFFERFRRSLPNQGITE
jgi:hypothetical protein